MTCNLDQLPLHVYTHRFMVSWGKSAKMNSYLKCVKQPNVKASERAKSFTNYTHFEYIFDLTPHDMELSTEEIKEKIDQLLRDKSTRKPKAWGVQYKNEYPFRVQSCIPIMIKQCRSSSIVAVKTIRFALDYALQIKQDVPDLKVIHYSRDPRGIISSRKAGDRRVAKNIDEEAKFLCRFMITNIEAQRKYSIAHDDSSILQLRYEDLAASPSNVTVSMYEFLHKMPPLGVLKALERHTHGGKHNGAAGTSRANSTATSLAWKDKLTDKIKNTIDGHCGQAIIAFDYDV